MVPRQVEFPTCGLKTFLDLAVNVSLPVERSQDRKVVFSVCPGPGQSIAAMNIPAAQERLKELGADLAAPERRTPEYLQKFVEREIEKWAAPIKAAGLSAE